jgi:hypothetical protein
VAGTPPTSPDLMPPRPTRLSPGGLPGVLLVVSLTAAVVGFGLGYRAGPGPEPTAVPSAAASPERPDIEPGQVSDRLASAFRATGDTWAVCVLDAAPACVRVNDSLVGVLPDPRSAVPAFTASDWGSLGPRAVTGPRLVIATDVAAEGAVAYLASASLGPSGPVRLDPVRDAGGAWYIDLGSPRPGRYAVLFGAAPTLTMAPFAASPAPWGWWTWVVALELE